VKPLADLESSALAGVRGVLADIDDTLTTDGRLTAEAYAALERLYASGLIVVPITGRPAGWCDHIARMWPVSGVVGENGAFWMRYDSASGKLVKRFLASDVERGANRARLARIGQEILAAIPGAALASDQPYRETDLAIDFREDVAPLPREQVDRIVAMMEAAGLTAKVSSIHVNGWFGRYDKLEMTTRFLDEAFGIDLHAQKDGFVFVGDSPNDAPMFAYFPLSVGVANVRQLADRIATLPGYVTNADAGAGFVELAERLMAAAGPRRPVA
jgi:HAD superfamily hydrolase (TIGR01484 family)